MNAIKRFCVCRHRDPDGCSNQQVLIGEKSRDSAGGVSRTSGVPLLLKPGLPVAITSAVGVTAATQPWGLSSSRLKRLTAVPSLSMCRYMPTDVCWRDE